MNASVLFFADRLPPLVGGMETHAEFFIKHFENHPKFRLKGVITKDSLDNDILLDNNSFIRLNTFQLKNELDFQPDILFFNSGRWIEYLGVLRKQFPSAFFIYRTGGNEIIKANLGKKINRSHSERQSYWAKQINAYMDTVVTNSKYTDDRLTQMGIEPSRFYRCVGGVEISDTKPVRGNNDIVTFLCVAR